jgi:hypothetical protein
MHVEASRAFVQAAQDETGRRGQGGRVTFLHGDFLALASTIPAADLVTLDRVLCCYHELDPLLLTSAALSRRYWAASFPRNRWYVHLYTRWENHRRGRNGDAFRTFVHPVARIYQLAGSGRAASAPRLSPPGLGDRALHPGELGEAGRIDVMATADEGGTSPRSIRRKGWPLTPQSPSRRPL